MKTLLSSLALLAASILPASATVYDFADFDYNLLGASGSAWSSGNLALGKFNSGFTPTSLNLSSWSGNFIGGPTGFFDGSGPEWGAELVLSNNATFGVGDQLYLWAYNSLAGSGQEWALLTDPAWKIITNSPLATDPVFFDFSSQTTAVFGTVNNGQSFVRAAAVLAATPVPEPATWVGVVSGAGLIGFLGYRRRHAKRVGAA